MLTSGALRRSFPAGDKPGADHGLRRDSCVLGVESSVIVQTDFYNDWIKVPPSDRIKQLVTNIERVFIGKPEAVKLAVTAVLAKGHLLIEDVPGVGKTILAKALARSIDCAFRRIQFTPDLLPSDILGVSVFNPSEDRFVFKPGPIFANVILADEINRTTPRTQSGLLEAMNDFHVSIDGVTHPLPEPFIVIATQNPFEFEGTYPLPENQLDRFLLRIDIGYPDTDDEKRILASQKLEHPLDSLEAAVSAEEVIELQALVRSVRVDESLVDYLLAIVQQTRQSERRLRRLGISPRGSLSLFRAAQALAMIEGRDYCTPDDIKHLAEPVLAHRLIYDGSAADQRSSAVQEVREILDSLSVPV